jgi:hypothetical protein
VRWEGEREGSEKKSGGLIRYLRIVEGGWPAAPGSSFPGNSGSFPAGSELAVGSLLSVQSRR